MTFEKLFESLPTGWLTEVEARLLWDCVTRTEGDILEVGCYFGRSTVLLAASGRQVHSVDPFGDDFSTDLKGDEIYKRFQQNLHTRSIDNVCHYRQKIENWQVTPCGLCYLDGDHTYDGTKLQIWKAQWCRPKIIAVHDVNDNGGGVEVKRACLEMLGPWKERVERLAMWEV